MENKSGQESGSAHGLVYTEGDEEMFVKFLISKIQIFVSMLG